jgi:hypothetical protein
MLRKAKLQCKLIYEPGKHQTRELIKQIETWQLSLIAPKNFDSEDTDNYIRRLELSFEALCASLEDLGVKNPGDLTIFHFYTRLIYYEGKKQKQTPRKR